MAKRNKPEDTRVVRKVPPRQKVTVGKPQKIITGSMKLGYPTVGGTVWGAGQNVYSPELSTDFLELPQSIDEQRNYYRFFYDNDPFVGQAIDLLVELPLSKVRFGMPETMYPENRPLAEAAYQWVERWGDRMQLLRRLMAIVFDYHLIGEVWIFLEDNSPEEPADVRYEKRKVVTDEGEAIEEWIERADANERAVNWVNRNYKGWTALRVLPPEQVHMESFSFTDAKIIELIVDAKTKDIIQKAANGEQDAIRIVETMPEEILKYVQKGENLPLNQDPEAGSFVHYMPRTKSDYEPRGHSILQRCIRILVHRDKLRQANASIASRHMTPIRLVWAEDMDIADTEELREQVDMALVDPDYSIVTNFEVHWEEMGSDQRLLDLSGEYDITDRQLYAGLSMTESLLSGEGSYSGDRINLEVINTRFMLLRELLQDFIDNNVVAPMMKRLGFVEIDKKTGEVLPIVPPLSFTRLSLRDNSEVFDAMFQMYQKGSLDVDVILELLNIDPVKTRKKLQRDLWTLNDPQYNELTRGVYSEAGRALVENSDVIDIIAKKLGLKYAKKDEGGDRF